MTGPREDLFFEQEPYRDEDDFDVYDPSEEVRKQEEQVEDGHDDERDYGYPW